MRSRTHWIAGTLVGLMMSSSAFGQEFQSKDDWRAKMLSEARVEKKLCHDKSYLVMCTTEFVSPETSAKTQLNTETCTEAVKEVVEASLSNGNPKGMFYEKLPSNLSVTAMTEYGNMLGDYVGKTILAAVEKNGGSAVSNPKCLLKRQGAFSVSGN
ncbi:MAG: hypothetical protein ACON5B_14070 [Myxococcota bacterium]